MATKDGEVIVQTRLPDTQIMVSNNLVLMQMVDTMGHVGNFLCESDDGGRRHFDGKVSGMKYIFYCSTLEIVGVEQFLLLFIYA